jgi:hypothetical protein
VPATRDGGKDARSNRAAATSNRTESKKGLKAKKAESKKGRGRMDQAFFFA